MEKQLAWDAASSSSGVVDFATPSVRAFQLRGAPWKIPLAALVFPWPLIRSPCHSAVARLCMSSSVVGADLPGERVARNDHERPGRGTTGARVTWPTRRARDHPVDGLASRPGAQATTASMNALT